MNIRNMNLLIVVVASAVALTTGCHHGLRTGVRGSGDHVTQKRQVPSFTSISTEGAFTIDIVCQREQTVQIDGDDNIVPLITTDVSNNVLHIKSQQDFSTKEPLTIKITVPNLEGISLTGAGKMSVSDLKNEKFEIDSTGAPAITASGETKTLKIDTEGAGKVDAHQLHATEVSVDSQGVSRVDVYAASKLDVSISGPSRVFYEGDPQVSKSINGPGSLEKKQSKEAKTVSPV